MKWASKFLCNLNSVLGWNSSSRLKYFENRVPATGACAADGIPTETVNQALNMFCEAFDIPAPQRLCILATDRIQDIYRSMVILADDLECERLLLNLEKAIDRRLSQ